MSKSSPFTINFWAGITGNVLEFYDTAVFSLIVPFIAPLFFPTFDPITAMAFTYGMLPLGGLARPVGSLVFGKMGDRYGRKKALSTSVIGLAAVTGLMGCLPTYHQAGYFAPALMALGRVMQNFFIGGEIAGGAVFILEHSHDSKHGLMSSLFGSSTIIGITLASSLIALLSTFGSMETLWRVPFLLGFATALGGFFVRRKAEESPLFSPGGNTLPLLQTLKTYWRPFLAIAVISGFSSANYVLALVLPNGFLPEIAPITKAEAMSINSMLLVADLLLLPFFGALAAKMTLRRSMLLSSLASAVLGIPLFAAFAGAGWMQIIAVRSLLVILGVWFSAPLFAWIHTLVPAHSRFSLIALGYAVGTQILGGPAAPISLWLYKETGFVAAPGLYWSAVALLSAVSVYAVSRPPGKERLQPVRASTAD